MRFIHTADIHLGACPDAGNKWSEARGKELWNTFEKLINIAEKEQVDLLLIAGDMFHRQPLVRELKEVNYLFSTLTKTKVVFIAGNHDYLKKDSYYHSFKWNDNVFALLGKEMQSVYFRDINTEVYGLSYHSRMIREPLYDNLRIKETDRVNVLLAHGGDEQHIPLQKQRLVRSGFDYVALGHIHKPQTLQEERIIYAGALEPTDINDLGKRGYIMGEITEEVRKISFIPLAKREYIHLKITIDAAHTAAEIRNKLTRLIEQYGQQNIYKIVLRGFISAGMELDLEHLQSIGNIAEIVDQTNPEYDFDKLLNYYGDHIIGKYIRRFVDSEPDSVERQALYLGLQALLEART